MLVLQPSMESTIRSWQGSGADSRRGARNHVYAPFLTYTERNVSMLLVLKLSQLMWPIVGFHGIVGILWEEFPSNFYRSRFYYCFLFNGPSVYRDVEWMQFEDDLHLRLVKRFSLEDLARGFSCKSMLICNLYVSDAQILMLKNRLLDVAIRELSSPQYGSNPSQ